MTKIRFCTKLHIYEISDAIPSRRRFNWIFPKPIGNVTLSHRVIYGRTSKISGVCAQANPFSISQFLASICIHFRPVTARIHQSISHSWLFSFALALSLPFYFFLSHSIPPDLISYIVSSAYHTLVCGTFTVIYTEEEIRMEQEWDWDDGTKQRWLEEWDIVLRRPVHCGQVI